MGNPTQVTGSTPVFATWGNDVVSRVVGVYATTAAAEADGRTEVGQVVSLTDASTWVKVSVAAGDWQPLVRADAPATLGNTTIDATPDAGFLRLVGFSTGGIPGMHSYVHWQETGGAGFNYYAGALFDDEALALSSPNATFLKLWDAAYTAKAIDAITAHVPRIEFFDSEAETILRYRMHEDGRHIWRDQNGIDRLLLGPNAGVYLARVFDYAGAVHTELSADGSTIQGSPLRGIRTGTLAPDDLDGNDGDIYVRQNATPSLRGLWIKQGGTWVECADHA